MSEAQSIVDVGDEQYAALLERMDPFLTLEAVTLVTSLSSSEIDRLRHRGDFPEPEKITGRRVGFRFSDVKKWMENPSAWKNAKPNEGEADAH